MSAMGDDFYKGGAWHRRTVELLGLLNDAVKVQRTPCNHRGIGRPGCVTCDPRIYNTLGVGQSAAPSKPDRRRTCWCGHRFGAHSKGGQCLAVVNDPDRSALIPCPCHGWEPR